MFTKSEESSLCVRCLINTLNFISLISGFILMVSGILICVDYKTLIHFLQMVMTLFPLSLTADFIQEIFTLISGSFVGVAFAVLGFLLITDSLIGYLGVYHRNKSLIVVYLILLFTTMSLCLILTLFMHLNQDKIQIEYLGKFPSLLIDNQFYAADAKEIHTYYNCCGFQSLEDYKNLQMPSYCCQRGYEDCHDALTGANDKACGDFLWKEVYRIYLLFLKVPLLFSVYTFGVALIAGITPIMKYLT